MSETTTNMGLTVWELLTDTFSHSQLYNNFSLIDAHTHVSGQGVQIPTGGIANQAITSTKIANNTITSTQVQAGGGVATVASGTLASRPTSGSLGQTYYATDTGAWYFYTGSSWEIISLAGAWNTVTTFYNGWTAASGVSVRYRLVGDVVQLSGAITGGSADNVAFVLPSGFYPSQEVILPAYSVSSNPAAYLLIYTYNGYVIPSESTLTYLYGLSFSTT